MTINAETEIEEDLTDKNEWPTNELINLALSLDPDDPIEEIMIIEAEAELRRREEAN
jgi:hypothetical protein